MKMKCKSSLSLRLLSLCCLSSLILFLTTGTSEAGFNRFTRVQVNNGQVQVQARGVNVNVNGQNRNNQNVPNVNVQVQRRFFFPFSPRVSVQVGNRSTANRVNRGVVINVRTRQELLLEAERRGVASRFEPRFRDGLQFDDEVELRRRLLRVGVTVR